MATKTKKVKKEKLLQMKDKRTGLLIGPDTRLIIANDKDAFKAVEAAGELQAEINQIRADNNLAVLEADYENLRKSLREYQLDNDLDEITSDEYVSHLTQRRKSFWVWSPTDIPENISLEDDVIPLRDVIKRKYRDLKRRTKIINRITTRVVVPSALDELVREGTLSSEDIMDSMAE